MAQCETRLAELKKRIVALDNGRMTISAEIAAIEQAQMPAMSFPNIVSLERVGISVPGARFTLALFYLNRLVELSHDFTAMPYDVSHHSRIAKPLWLWMSGPRAEY